MGERIHSSQRDALTQAPLAITTDHNYIHKGKAFTLPYTTASLASAAVDKIGFTTPAASTGKYIHWRPSRISGIANAAKIQLYEDTDYTGGTLTIAPNRNRASGNYSILPMYTGVTAALTGRIMVSAEAGGGFANQPAGDGLELVSDNAADIGQIVTIYGTKTGTTTTVVTESIALNGTDAVSTVVTTWQNILAVEMDSVAAGTVTIREASANATIITLATTVLSAGISAIDITNARGKILTQVCSDTSTAPVGVIGTSWDGSDISVVTALNGATPANVGTTPMQSISKVLIGAVAANRTVTVTRPELILDINSVGSGGASNSSGGQGKADEEIVLDQGTKYVVTLTNAGASTATVIDASLFWYEESGGVDNG